MRRYRFDRRNRLDHLGYDCYDNVVIVGDVTINTINQNNMVCPHKHKWTNGGNKNHSRFRQLKQGERKPKLLRFVGSCGLLDRDKAVYHMDNGTFGKEMANSLSYTSRDLSRNVKGIGHGVCQIGRAVGSVVGNIFGLLK